MSDAFSSARQVCIAGTGSYLPEQVLTNADFEKRVDTTDEWIVTRTGIRERRIAAAMLLRFSLGESEAADAIDFAVAKTIDDGLRTGDIATGAPGETKVGTRQMADAIIERL